MTIRQWQRLGHKVILGGGMFLAWTGADSLFAQGPTPTPVGATQPANSDTAPVRRNYMNRNVIDLPITMDDSARALIQEIHLYVKDQPGAPWVLRDKGNSTQKAFRFQAPRDGEFWFTMVTLDKQGRSFPQDLQNEPPGLVVVIDTQKPAVEMIGLGESKEGQLIQCEVRDANVDNARVRFYYQSGDKVFRSIESVPGRPGVYCIPRQAVCTGLVRLVAEDLAGNQSAYEDHINQLQAKQSAPAKTQQVAVNPPANVNTNPPANINAKPPVETTQPNPLPRVFNSAVTLEPNEPRPRPSRATDEPASKVAYRPDGSDGPRFIEHKVHTQPPSLLPTGNEPRLPASPQAPASPALPAKRQLVNNRKLFLDYHVENAGQNAQSKIEVWLTRDQGRSWQKSSEDTIRKGPVEILLPGDGLFGITLIVNNGRPTTAPAGEEAADMWIDVDTTRPMAQITKVEVTHDKGQATVLLQWTAQDHNLSETPVDLFYAATAQGPWLPIAKGLKSEGQYRWTPPAEIGAQAHVRLIARDRAGNSGICNTLDAVSLEDTSRPRIFIRNIRTESPTSAPVMPSPSPRTGSTPFPIIQN